MSHGVFRRSHQLLLNKFSDPSTPSMRKGCDGEEVEEVVVVEKNSENSVPLLSCQSTARTATTRAKKCEGTSM